MKRIIVGFFVALFTYYTVGALALHFYLDSLVFKTVKQSDTNEIRRLSTTLDGNEIFIRSYGSLEAERCVVYYPGRSGGIPRYEKDIFNQLTQKGLSVHAVSYPGYEGAKGESNFSSIIHHIELAIKNLEEQSSCRTSDSVFVARSLGAALAVEAAKSLRPKAIILDSVLASLESAVNYELRKTTLTKPFLLLPVKSLLPINHNLAKSLGALDGIEYHIFQGENDCMMSHAELISRMKDVHVENITEVPAATHSNAYKLAGDAYINMIVGATLGGI